MYELSMYDCIYNLYTMCGTQVISILYCYNVICNSEILEYKSKINLIIGTYLEDTIY